jgi:hypothetical protein
MIEDAKVATNMPEIRTANRPSANVIVSSSSNLVENAGSFPFRVPLAV